MDQLEVLLPSRVTVVSAPIGFGKTTLLSPLADRPGTVWVDASGVGDPADLFDRALGHPGRRVLVVDNAHLLPPGRESTRLLAAAIRSGERPTRIALVGQPPLGAATVPSAVPGGVTRICESELALTGARLERVVTDRLGAHTSAITARLHTLTAGWPALVRLALDAAASAEPGDTAAAIEACFEQGGRGLAYVEERVLIGLTAAQSEVLAFVARLGATPLGSLPGGDPYGPEMQDLIEARLLQVQPDTGLVDLAPTLGHAFRRALILRPVRSHRRLRRLAAQQAQGGDYTRALGILSGLGDQLAMAELLAEHGDQILSSGHVTEVVAAIQSLRAEQRVDAVHLLEGRARQVIGDHDGALRCYERLDNGGELSPELAWRMGVIHYLQGEPALALACYRRGRLADETTAEEAQLLSWMASALWLSGDADAGGLAERAFGAARVSGDDSALAAAHVAMALQAGLVGARRDLNEHYDRAFAHATEAGDRLQLVRICTNRGSHLIDEGHIDRALTDLELARTTARQAGFVAFEGLCEVNTGEAHLRLGNLGEALAAFARAQASYQRIGSRKVAYALNGIGDVHRLRSALTLARAAYEEALDVSDDGEDVQALVPALCGLALATAQRDLAGALLLAERATEVPGAGVGRAWLTLGWLALARSREQAGALAARAGELAARQRDWVTLAESHELAALAVDEGARRGRFLREAEHAWQQSGSTLGLLRLRHARWVLSKDGSATRLEREAWMQLDRLGVEVHDPGAAGLLASLPGEFGGRIRVVTLGRFQLRRDVGPVDGPITQSRKARELLKILIARGHPVPKEEMMDLLWPDQPPAVLTNRLAVAVTAIRKSLDPQHEHPADWVLQSRTDTLSLDLRHLDVDIVRFLSDGDSALRLATTDPAAAAAPLAALLERYEGDFLEDEPYAAWAEPMRAQGRNMVSRCREALGTVPPTGIEPALDPF